MARGNLTDQEYKEGYYFDDNGNKTSKKVSRADIAAYDLKHGTGPNAQTEVGKNRIDAADAEITGKVQGAVNANQAANNTSKDEAKELVTKLTDQAKKDKAEEEVYDSAQTKPGATQEAAVKAAETVHNTTPEEAAKVYDANHTVAEPATDDGSDDGSDIVALSGTDEDGNTTETVVDNPEATDEEKQTAATEAELAFNKAISGLVSEDGTMNKDALMDYVSRGYHEPSTLLKILNVIGGLIHTATLGIVPRLDFMKVTGQTELLDHLNNEVDSYNKFQADRAKSYNDKTLEVAGNAANLRNTHLVSKLNAADTTNEDIDNATRLGQFNYNITGDAARDTSALEGEIKKLGIQGQQAKDLAKLGYEYQINLQSLNQQFQAAENDKDRAQQEKLMKQANDLKIAYEKQMFKYHIAETAVNGIMSGIGHATGGLADKVLGIGGSE